MSGKYIIRRYEKGDKDKIFGLVETVWGKVAAAKTKALWDWEFENNPNNLPDGPTILVVQRDGSIVGLLSGIFISIKIKEKVLRAIWGVDAMVHPKHRGAGIKLIRKFRDLPYIAFGSPNELAYKIEKKLGLFDSFQFKNHILLVNPGNIFRNKIRNRVVVSLINVIWRTISELILVFLRSRKARCITLSKINKFDEDINEFWQEASQDYEIIVVRDKRYLNWRFFECSSMKYTTYLAKTNGRISGYIVVRCMQKGDIKYGYIVDVLTRKNDKKSLCCLVSKAVNFLKLEGADIISCLIPAHSGLYERVLFKNGFIFRKMSVKVVAKNNYSFISDEELKESRNYFMTLSDSDLDICL